VSAVADAMWDQVEPLVYITRAEWDRGLEGWTIEPVEHDGVLAFAFVTRGAEFHFATFGRGVPISMRMIRERVEPLIARHGFALTRTPKDATRQRRLNEAIGFVAAGEDEFYITYRVETLRGRRQLCPLSQ
jgi:hypothetical protein